MFKNILLIVSLSTLIFCKPAGSTKNNKSDKSDKEVKISVSSAGLITVENCETSYTVKLVNTALADHPNFKGVQCKIDLVSWVDKPDKGDPYVILSSNQTLNSKVKGSFYAVSTHLGQYKAVNSGINVCNLTACGKEIYLLDTDFRPSEIVLGDLAPGSNIVNLKFADNHGLNHHMDSEIDVVVQQWDKDKELYIANPLKNRKKIIVRNIYPMDDAPIDSSSLEITVDLDGYTKARSKHHIWVRHKKGIELEIPAIEAWGTPGVTPPPGAEF